MASLNMQGPYDLNKDTINDIVVEVHPGNYALGQTDDEGKFLVSYVGRSDDNVRGRLHDYVGKYEKFKFSYAFRPQDAFEEECQNYHDFIDYLDNEIHPDRPDGTNLICPICGHPDL